MSDSDRYQRFLASHNQRKTRGTPVPTEPTDPATSARWERIFGNLFRRVTKEPDQ